MTCCAFVKVSNYNQWRYHRNMSRGREITIKAIITKKGEIVVESCVQYNCGVRIGTTR